MLHQMRVMVMEFSVHSRIVVDVNGDATRQAVVDRYTTSGNNVVGFLGEPSACGNTDLIISISLATLCVH